MDACQNLSKFNRAFVVTGGSAVLFAGLGFLSSAHVADMLVPSDLFPTLPDAVADASINGDPVESENRIDTADLTPLADSSS